MNRFDVEIGKAMKSLGTEAEVRMPPGLRDVTRLISAQTPPDTKKTLRTRKFKRGVRSLARRLEIAAACLVLAGAVGIAAIRGYRVKQEPAAGVTQSISLHAPIKRSDVVAAELWGVGQEKRMATAEETEKIVQWFNAATDPRENKQLAGPTPDAVITVGLGSGREIRILRAGEDFEVARDGKQYWLKQQEMRHFLDMLTTK